MILEKASDDCIVIKLSLPGEKVANFVGCPTPAGNGTSAQSGKEKVQYFPHLLLGKSS